MHEAPLPSGLADLEQDLMAQNEGAYFSLSHPLPRIRVQGFVYSRGEVRVNEERPTD